MELNNPLFPYFDFIEYEYTRNIINIPNVVQVSAGGHFSLFLDNDGCVWGCGDSVDGQLGVKEEIVCLRKIINQHIVQISTGGNHSLLLDEKGRVWVAGWNGCGQCGIGYKGYKENIYKFQLISRKLLKIPIIQISAGGDHSVLLDKNKNVWVFGNHLYNKLGVKVTIENGEQHIWQIDPLKRLPVSVGFDEDDVMIPIKLDHKADSISAGMHHTELISHTTLMGDKTADQLIDINHHESKGMFHKLHIMDGNVYAYGSNRFGQLGK